MTTPVTPFHTVTTILELEKNTFFMFTNLENGFSLWARRWPWTLKWRGPIQFVMHSPIWLTFWLFFNAFVLFRPMLYPHTAGSGNESSLRRQMSITQESNCSAAHTAARIWQRNMQANLQVWESKESQLLQTLRLSTQSKTVDEKQTNDGQANHWTIIGTNKQQLGDLFHRIGREVKLTVRLSVTSFACMPHPSHPSPICDQCTHPPTQTTLHWQPMRNN